MTTEGVSPEAQSTAPAVPADCPSPSRTQLHLAVLDCMRMRLTLADTINRLWREDPQRVTAAYDTLLTSQSVLSEPSTPRYGLRAERMRELRRPHPRGDRPGLTVQTMADDAGVPREVMSRLLEHHGYLTLAPYGGRQQRRLVSEAAFRGGYGYTVDAAEKRIAHLEGTNRAAPFAVFYPEHIPSILWTLGIDAIREGVAQQPTKRKKLRWLLDHHDYLPSSFIAELTGCSVRGVKKARATWAVNLVPSAEAA